MENVTEQLLSLSVAENSHRRSSVFVHGTAQRQCFAFPKHVMDHIIANPRSPKQWKKLIQTCKLFFEKNSIIIFENLGYNTSKGWQTWEFDLHERPVDFFSSSVPFKIWLTESLDVVDGFGIAKWFISLIFKCDIKELDLVRQYLTFEQFSSLTANVADAVIDDRVYDINGAILPFEKIIKSMPKLEILEYCFLKDGRDVTPESVKAFIEMDQVKKLQQLTFIDIPSTFDFHEFSKFMLENKQIKFMLLFFDETTTDEYMENVKTFVEKLKEEEYGEGNERPKIYLNGINLVISDEVIVDGQEEDNIDNLYFLHFIHSLLF